MTQPPQQGGTSLLVFFVDLWAGGAVFTFQLNHPSTAERSKVHSNISGCGGVWRYKRCKETLPLMLVAGETCYKPGETPGMWLNGTALLAIGFHRLGRIFLPLAGENPLAWDPVP